MNNDKFCNQIKKFSSEFIKMIDDKKNSGKEHGIKFCSTNEGIVLSNICVGNECSIPSQTETRLECKDKKPSIGILHTHPGYGEGLGTLSDEDVMYAIATEQKYSCIGYRGDTKTIRCYEHPFGIPEGESEKFKNTNIMSRQRKLIGDREKYGVNIFGDTFIPKTDTSNEQWEKLKEETKYVSKLKDNLRKYINRPGAQEERLKNSCTISISPFFK